MVAPQWMAPMATTIPYTLSPGYRYAALAVAAGPGHPGCGVCLAVAQCLRWLWRGFELTGGGGDAGVGIIIVAPQICKR